MALERPIRLRPKLIDQRRHALRRARRRLGFEWAEHDLNRIKNLIQRGESQFIEEQSTRISVHRVTDSGKTFLVVYDRLRKTPVTFITETMWARGRPVR